MLSYLVDVLKLLLTDSINPHMFISNLMKLFYNVLFIRHIIIIWRELFLQGTLNVNQFRGDNRFYVVWFLFNRILHLFCFSLILFWLTILLTFIIGNFTIILSFSLAKFCWTVFIFNIWLTVCEINYIVRLTLLVIYFHCVFEADRYLWVEAYLFSDILGPLWIHSITMLKIWKIYIDWRIEIGISYCDKFIEVISVMRHCSELLSS